VSTEDDEDWRRVWLKDKASCKIAGKPSLDIQVSPQQWCAGAQHLSRGRRRSAQKERKSGLFAPKAGPFGPKNGQNQRFDVTC
jgi:hypothetical protein